MTTDARLYVRDEFDARERAIAAFLRSAPVGAALLSRAPGLATPTPW
ncbi:hypothetical protein ACFQRB_18660 [Halobaculum litoreum]|uniref:Uncharacterized protein n=1 Tax=Halobaculum litoreum TaxID=3031998 RepID=A0ABD5Y0I5_9EURY